MIKIVELVQPVAGISEQRFHYHWRVIHSPLVLEIKRNVSYIQNHEIDPSAFHFRSAGTPGVVEVEFPDISVARDTLSSSEYLNYAKLDEPNFANLETVVVYPAQQMVVLENDIWRNVRPVRAIIYLTRSTEVNEERFAEELIHQARRISQFMPNVQRVAVSFPIDAPELTRNQPYDAEVSLWFAAIEEYDESLAQADMLAACLAKVADLEASVSVLVEQFRFKADGVDRPHVSLQPTV